jgi:hypothetical protein
MCIKTVKVKTENGLNDCKICLIQGIEKEIDKVMASNGFSRTTTTKSGITRSSTSARLRAVPMNVVLYI